MATPQEILENLRRASVQHGAAIRTLLEDVKAMATDLQAVIAKQKATDEQIAQLVADLQTLAGGAGAAGGEGEAPSYDGGEEDEEDAEYEEAGG